MLRAPGLPAGLALISDPSVVPSSQAGDRGWARSTQGHRAGAGSVCWPCPLPSLTCPCPYCGHGALSHRPSLRSRPNREGQVQVCGCQGDIPHLHSLSLGLQGCLHIPAHPPHEGGSSIKGESRARAVGGMRSPAWGLGRLPGDDVTTNPSLQG